MSSGMLGTGISGLLAAQQALTTTSHNISNVNTEGYSRQRVEMGVRPAKEMAYGFVGQGVDINQIERIYGQFQTLQIRSSASGHSQFKQFNALASQIDNLMADPQAGLMPTLQEFFNAVQGVADEPSSLPARQVLMTGSQTLIDRFHYLDGQLDFLQQNVNQEIGGLVSEVNNLAGEIAGINRTIALAQTQGSGQPNDLLDKRDTLLKNLSEKVSVTTFEQGNGAVNVFLGNGQTIVSNFTSQQLTLMGDVFDAERIEIGYQTDNSIVNVTAQLGGGELGGVLNFRDEVLNPTKNAVGHVALTLSDLYNDQHRLGMDLNGVAGTNFFSDLAVSSPKFLANSNNSGNPAAQLNLSVTDSTQLTTSDYRLERIGSVYSLTRLSDQQVTTLSTFPGGSETVDGLTISLGSGVISDGDSFLIQPTKSAAGDVNLLLSDPARIAAASATRAIKSINNTGSSGAISAGAVTDATLTDGDNYQITMADVTAAAANGTTIGAINEDVNTLNTLQYSIIINGTTVHTQNEGDPVLADLDAVASAINDDTGVTGVRAIVDPAAGRIYLSNSPQNARPITLTEQLVDSNPALPLDPGDNVSGYFGSNLNGSAATNTLIFSGAADSYVVEDSVGNVETSGNYSTGVAVAFNGLSFDLSGNHNLGDNFSVSPNTSGTGDNRNALALAQLQVSSLLKNGSTTFEGAYSQLAVDIGTKTHRAQVNEAASLGILNQAEAARESMSGVNLDEEAANLIKYQQVYQAAAQVIAAANQMFQVLLNSTGR